MRRALAAAAVGVGALMAEHALGEKFSRSLQPAAAPVRLAGSLAEVSGLAPASTNSVYALGDEQALIFELDARSGKVLRKISFGRPPLVGDFEAIAVRNGHVALITSAGVIYEATLDPRRRALDYRTLDTGLGANCEIEAFAPGRTHDAYFIACKRLDARLIVYEWSPGAGAKTIIDRKLGKLVPNPKDFKATDMVADDRAGSLLILDASAGALLEVSMTGEKLSYWRLGGNHPQAEGLALLSDGALLVADEGKIGKGTITGGALTRYPPRH